jgi:hypothetical protein
VGTVSGNIVGVAFDAHVFAAGSQDLGEAIDGTDGGSTHGAGATFVKTDFAKTDDEAFLPGFDVDDAASNLGRERFLESRLNVLERPGRGSGAEDALHGLHEPLHIGGSFNVLHRLYLGERHGSGVTERDAGVGCLKNTEFLEAT